MDLEHQFDSKGFLFSVKLVVLGAMLALTGQYGLPYAQAYLAPTASSLFVARTVEIAPDTAQPSSPNRTPERSINPLAIEDAVPQTGKFIAADLEQMKLYLFQDGVLAYEYQILTKGRPGSPYETPSGFYEVLTKEQTHFNRGEQVYMPYSMQFYGNYFIHGWPYYPSGAPVASTYSGGCIRLSTADAQKVYAFAEKGTGLFVYDSYASSTMRSLALGSVALPSVTAASYLVADIDTGDVFLEREATTPRPIASVTKLMTALVANETIMFDKEISVPRGVLLHPQATSTATLVNFTVGDLLYPLLMESNNVIAAKLASYYGTAGFIKWMNKTAEALNMSSTGFADASGISPDNISTTEDLYRLAVYLTNKKSFIWDVTRTPAKTLVAQNGATYTFSNFNKFAHVPSFVGGKIGRTGQALDTMASVFSTPVDGVPRRVAIIVLRSTDSGSDTAKLSDWFIDSAEQGFTQYSTACVSCSIALTHRKIDL